MSFKHVATWTASMSLVAALTACSDGEGAPAQPIGTDSAADTTDGEATFLVNGEPVEFQSDLMVECTDDTVGFSLLAHTDDLEQNEAAHALLYSKDDPAAGVSSFAYTYPDGSVVTYMEGFGLPEPSVSVEEGTYTVTGDAQSIPADDPAAAVIVQAEFVVTCP